MNLRNVKLVCRRELQDQLRDRRTLFMVAVLPLLMYPLMGTSFFQLSQFMRGHTADVLVVGADQLEQTPGFPPLIDGDRFAASLFTPPTEAKRIRVERQSTSGVTPANRQSLAGGEIDVIVQFPDDFSLQLSALRARSRAMREGSAATPLGAANEIDVPQPVVLFNSLRESSRVARSRVDGVLGRWKQRIIKKNLRASGAPPELAKPFDLAEQDVAEGRGRFVGLWSMLLPFVAFVWALTGAFYPAIDLCAGEKERGTLETLLASPASRDEIVWGKLLTVMIFSLVTAVLNLAGMAITSRFIAGQLGAISGLAGLTSPPISAMVWLLLALVPLSALFAALSLACASFARSTKEGQYYFMPLFLALMPLMMIPMAPGVELTPGNALVPVMGLVLVLQALLEQRAAEALPYLLPVAVVLLGCCLLAIKWAVWQFNQESVLFRESERFDLRLWLARTFRQRDDQPTAGMAVFALGTILGLQFFANSLLSSAAAPTLASIVTNIVVSQACVVGPVLVLTFAITRRPWATLRLDHAPAAASVLGAACLAVAMHPVGATVTAGIRWLYPLDAEALEQIQQFLAPLSGAPLALVLLLTAVLPAICEEITFRGFLLGGLRKAVGPVTAIVLSSVAFGFVHTILQQSLGAVFLGLFLGYLTVKTQNLLPAIAFHGFYNSLPILILDYYEGLDGGPGSGPLGASWFWPSTDGVGLVYPPAAVAAGLVLSGLILWWIGKRPASNTARSGDPPSMVGEPLLPSEAAESR
ncbi:MAG: ABC transporter permease subunit/CPBP intramembrane protease, partial [Planctomycetota bacterium]